MPDKDKEELEIVFVEGGETPTQIDAPTSLGRPTTTEDVGMFTKFVTLKTLLKVLKEDGTEERMESLIGLYTWVRKNKLIPEHINILRLLEKIAATRGEVMQQVQISGGKIGNLSELMKAMREKEGEETDASSYGASSPRFDSESIKMARGSDKPADQQEQKLLLDEIVARLETFAQSLKE